MKAVGIGASSGGPRALWDLVGAFPADLPAYVFIAQHLPPKFTESMSLRMERHLDFCVKEIEDRQKLRPSCAYVVPGDQHFFVQEPGPCARLLQTEDLVRPSVDMALTSIADHFGPDSIGVILTGMGSDGVQGARAIQQVGGHVITQDESSSAIYGMPKAVHEAGLSSEVLPLDKIAKRIEELVT